MRTTTVPAQITTVEDKIVGEISLIQLLLLVAPVFASAAIFVALPPFYSSASYKVALIVCIFVAFGMLAIRIKGRILLTWLIILTKYSRRPRYYLFNKNDSYMRDTPRAESAHEESVEAAPTKTALPVAPRPSTAELLQVERLLENPSANLHFRVSKKGVLSVHVNEIK
jgi:hypothetical protein